MRSGPGGDHVAHFWVASLDHGGTKPTGTTTAPVGAPVVSVDDLSVAWKDVHGNDLPTGGAPPTPLVVATRRGAEHCGWESAVIMSLAVPVGEPTRETGNIRQFVRDPEDALGHQASHAVPFDPRVPTMPDDAAPTGFTNGAVELWVAPSTFNTEVCVGAAGAFEAWPLAAREFGCD